MSFRVLVQVLFLSCLIAACATATTHTPSPLAGTTLLPEKRSSPTSFFQSSGTGDPRTVGYWLLWNTCAENNQSATAKSNGGREAGWILMDDLLTDPGIMLGELEVTTCQQAVHLLQGHDLQGVDHQNDIAYTLATQLLAAQLNLATGSEYCPTSDQVVSQAQLLLLELKFNGTGGYLGPPLASQKIEDAQMLMEQLANYNSGTLCE